MSPEFPRSAGTLWRTGRRLRTPAATSRMDLALPQRRLLRSAPKPSASFPAYIDCLIVSVVHAMPTIPHTFPRYM